MKITRVAVCGHVVPEVHVRLVAAVPNGLMVEHVPRSAAILQSMPAIDAGEIVVPSAPGPALALHEDSVRRCRAS